MRHINNLLASHQTFDHFEKTLSSPARRRKGAVVVLAAFMMLILLAMVAFAVDVGYIATVRTELQAAADSAALAAAANLADQPANVSKIAKDYAGYHSAGGHEVELASSDIEYGLWDASARTFTPLGSPGSPGAQVSNGIRVTARRSDAPAFFSRIFGINNFDAKAEAVAIGNPRDICFVVDLSGSMNDDTEPGYTGNGGFSGSFSSVREDMMQAIFDDFGYGSYPGNVQVLGYPLVTSTSSATNNFNTLSSSSGPLNNNSIPSKYRIKSGDSSSTRQQKAYSWLMDVQIGQNIMPNAKPTPNSSNSNNYKYWQEYIDKVRSANGRFGYRTYVHFMQYQGGRDRRPGGGLYTSLSVKSPDCPLHSESTAGGTFQFPPREQPTHACRRSIIAALNQIKSKNQTITDPTQKDWVSIVTFDSVAGTQLELPLTHNYDNAMEAATKIQAIDNLQLSTATETGLIEARNHVKAQSQGGHGRENTQKVIVLLTDGMANLKSSSSGTISSYMNNHPSNNWYSGWGGNDNSNAALMQADIMNEQHWKTFAVGVGFGVDQSFMDRVARMGGTANDNGEAPQIAGDPSQYETVLSHIFKQIVDNPQVRLVK